MEIISLKYCRRCDSGHPATSEFFHRRLQAKDGLALYCKNCVRIAAQEAKERNPEQEKARQRRYRERNPEKIKASRRDFHERNPGRRRDYHLKWYWGKVDINQHKARLRNRERVLYKAAHARARRARIKAAQPISQAQLAAKLKAQGGKCYWCQTPLRDEHHIDHIFPLARGGEHAIGNLCFACPSCNRSKSAKSPLEFAGRLF